MKIQDCTIFEDEYIFGTDPEYADMGNPDGCRYSRALFISAITPNGRRYILSGVQFELEESKKAQSLVNRIKNVGAISPGLWVETFSVYGSSAWQEEDMERQDAWDSNPATRGFVRDY